MIRYLFVVVDYKTEYYIFYWANSDKMAMDKAAIEYPNYTTIGIISREEYLERSIKELEY